MRIGVGMILFKRVIILFALIISFSYFVFAEDEDKKTEAVGVKVPCDHCDINSTESALEENTNCNNPNLPDSIRCDTSSSEDSSSSQTSGVE